MNRSDAFGRMWQLLERSHRIAPDLTDDSTTTLINERNDLALEHWITSRNACKEFIELYKKYFAPRVLGSWELRWMNSNRPKNYNKKVWEHCYREALDNKEWATDTLTNNKDWFSNASASSREMIGAYLYLDPWVLAKETYDYLETRSHGVVGIGYALDESAKNKWEAITGKHISKAKTWKYD